MRSLQTWEPHHGSLPAGVDGVSLAEAERDAEVRLAPADNLAFGVLLFPLIDYADKFGIGAKKNETAEEKKARITGWVEQYRAALDLPPDLLKKAVQIALKEWAWGHRLPLPGELLAFVKLDRTERIRDLATLRAARQRNRAGVPTAARPLNEMPREEREKFFDGLASRSQLYAEARALPDPKAKDLSPRPKLGVFKPLRNPIKEGLERDTAHLPPEERVRRAVDLLSDPHWMPEDQPADVETLPDGREVPAD